MNKEDLRFIKCEEIIIKTFKEMIEEMNYEDITIKELTKRANINRKTFYLHYPSLDHLLEKIQSELITEYTNRTNQYDLINDFEQIIREFYLFSEEQGVFYEKITSNPSYDYIRNQMIRKVKTKRKSSTINELVERFINETTLGIYRYWIETNKKIPVEEIIQLSIQLIKNGFASQIHS